jgi:hypothetical protein
VEQSHELKPAFLALQQNKSGGIEGNISALVKTHHSAQLATSLLPMNLGARYE